MTLTVMIVGGGRVGSDLASLLTEAGHRAVVLDCDPAWTARLTETLPAVRVVTADGTDPGALEAAGIRAADVVAAVTGDDAHNVVVAALARLEFGVTRTVARVVDPRHAWLFCPETGVDVAVDQADLVSRLIVAEIWPGEHEAAT